MKLQLGKNFFPSSSIPLNIEFDAFVLTVGTPLDSQNLQAPNMQVLDYAISSIRDAWSYGAAVILRSTIPVGTSRLIAENLRKELNLSDIDVCFCPERTAEGKALDELGSLPQVISGNSVKAITAARKIFEVLVDEIVVAESLEEAELIKLLNNTYRDATFALANTFNAISQSFGVDGNSVIAKANHNYPRSSIPKPGFVAGPCLEKDAYILASNMLPGFQRSFLLDIRAANQSLEQSMAQRMAAIIKAAPQSKILFSGMAFKGVPQTNDLRGSSSLKILSELKGYRDNIVVHDFMNSKVTLENATGMPAIGPDDLDGEFPGCFDWVVILNNHPLYKAMATENFIRNHIDAGGTIIDSWDVLGGVASYTVGNFLIEGEGE
jgi:nucleotide sugar dehydrogenase